MNIKGIPDVYSLINYSSVTSILVVGCGGTGGYVVPNLLRLVSSLNNKINIYLADGDIVEEKNLIRQNFINADINKNKALVLASRYSKAFGLEINAITNDIEDVSLINNINASLVIGCVDNNASRKIINQWFLNNSYYVDKFWIDSGNEETAGQVICGFNSRIHLYGPKLFNLPSVMEVYPELNDDSQFNSQLSCAERSMSSPQNILTNITASTLVMNFVQKILRNQPLTSHGVNFSINNNFSTLLNTKENLQKVDFKRRRKGMEVYG